MFISSIVLPSFFGSLSSRRALSSAAASSRLSSWLSSPSRLVISLRESVPDWSVSAWWNSLSMFSSLYMWWSCTHPPTNSRQSISPSPSRSNELRSSDAIALDAASSAAFSLSALLSSSMETVPVPSESRPSNMLRSRCSSSEVSSIAILCRIARWKRVCCACCLSCLTTCSLIGLSPRVARLEIHGWPSACLPVRRLVGSWLSSCFTKSFPSSETLPHAGAENEKEPAWILASFSASLRPLKGSAPLSIK
mmetsp:Transcript_22812/g.61158  ORF Transcript_22812/g.61158 Transcript_22812/m.61158 type:complete len:251 (-) Transcript_22812:684-1436(-)